MRSPPTLRRWVGPSVALIALGGLALAARQGPALALINESPSLPRGLYARSLGGGIERGAIVAIPQPERGRAYLASVGMPDEVALIKRVGAVGGDAVCAQTGGCGPPSVTTPYSTGTGEARPFPAGRDAAGSRPVNSFCSATRPGVSTAAISGQWIGPWSAASIGRF